MVTATHPKLVKAAHAIGFLGADALGTDETAMRAAVAAHFARAAAPGLVALNSLDAEREARSIERAAQLAVLEAWRRPAAEPPAPPGRSHTNLSDAEIEQLIHGGHGHLANLPAGWDFDDRPLETAPRKKRAAGGSR